MTNETKCKNIILVGFCSRMAASILGPVFIKEFKEEYPITKVINFFTRTAYIQQYGLNFDTVLAKHNKSYKKYLLAENVGSGLKSFLNFKTPIDEFTLYNEVIHYSEIVEKIIETIKNEKGDKPFQILFNSGGGNSHHQQMLTDCYWRLKEEHPQEVFNVYLDYHTGLNLYQKNISGSTIETSVTLYPYDAEISMEDLVSLDKKKVNWKNSEKIYPVVGNKEGEIRLDENYWNMFMEDYRIKNEKDNAEEYRKNKLYELFNKTSSLSEKIKDSSDEDEFINHFLDTLKKKRNNTNYSYKDFLNILKGNIIFSKPSNEKKLSLGTHFEKVVINDVKKCIKNKTPILINEIYANPFIDPETVISFEKEYDIVLLKKNMTLFYYEIKGRFEEKVKIQSVLHQIQKGSSDFTKIQYVIPFDPMVDRCLRNDFFEFIKRFDDLKINFLVYAPSSPQIVSWIIERKNGNIKIIDNANTMNDKEKGERILVKNFIPHFKREIGLD